MSGFVPDEGDIVWLHLSPTVGREQAGHRPAVVLTKASYNRRSGLMFCVPMTSRVKNYPFEVIVGRGAALGAALVDHARSVDWEGREIRHKGRVTDSELEAIRAKLHKLIG